MFVLNMLFCFFVVLSSHLLYTKPFLYTYIFLCIGGIYIQYTFTQESLSHSINSLYNPLLDFVCKYGTHIGDGLFFLIASAFISLFNRKMALVFVLSYLLSSILAQGLKHLIFTESLRPAMVLDLSRLHIIDGVEIRNYNSFPSGHTTTAFAFFALLSFYAKNRLIKIAYILPAVFVGFTRIYLLQHFFEDTLFGSLLGVISAVVVYYSFSKFKPKKDE
jgi:membrane-associated phospholipid phosphatase